MHTFEIESLKKRTANGEKIPWLGAYGHIMGYPLFSLDGKLVNEYIPLTWPHDEQRQTEDKRQ